MNISPGPALLNSLRTQSLQWKTVLGELIDNSFDAGATRVEIVFGPKRQIEVKDNGLGCDDIEAMLTLGRHYRQPTTRLGRYGVGLKDAACWLWGVTNIVTIKKGVRRVCRVDWAKLASAAEWYVPDPEQEQARDEPGTCLVFRNIARNLPNDPLALMRELSYTFTPGLLQGRQIVFRFPKKKPLTATPYALPPLDDVVQDEFLVNGRGVKIHVGIVKEGHPNEHPGFAFCHHHRVITTTALGCGGLSPARIAGQVWLDNSWSISRNKDELVDGQDELSEALFSRLRPMLEKHRSRLCT